MASLVNGLGGSAGFGENSMPRNDDSPSISIDLSSILPQGLNFFGTTYTSLWLNYNGSVSFGSGLTSYSPTTITGSGGVRIIAPFWADVDIRNTKDPTPGTNLIWWDLDVATKTFTATWDDVGYYREHNDRTNAFQLRLVGKDTPGDFDIYFYYESIGWLTGDASGGKNGTGGNMAHAGYSSGNGKNYFEITQSGTTGMFGLPGLSNINQGGVYLFEVRNGAVPLFTSAADIVDFNHLTDDQKTSIIAGNNIYDGKGGSDTVFLPDKANYDQVIGQDKDGKDIKLSWNSAAPFEAGDIAGQNYLITGGNGSDTIKLGDGNDTVFASPGNDEIFFGSGHNRFDYRSGNYAGFSGFAAGTHQIISHSLTGPPKTFQTDSALQSVLELPGSPSDYDTKIFLANALNKDFGQASVVFKTTGTTLTTPITIDTFGVERVRYTDPQVGTWNTVVLAGTQIGPLGSSGTLASETMKLVDEVYNPTGFQTLKTDPLNLESPGPRSVGAKARGWHLLQAMELGMAPMDFGQRGPLVYTFVDGLYAAYDTSDYESGGSYSQADAFALVGMVNGKRTLSVDFRGTDQGLDFFDFFTFSVHYAKFAPLIAALRAYADDPANGIQQVLVAGHSLGAGMTGYFLRDFAGPQYNLVAYTDGSPGFEQASADGRIINFIHPHDAVAWLPNINGPNSNPLIKTALIATAVGGIIGGLATSYTGVGATVGIGAGALSAILLTMQPKFRNGTDIIIDDVNSVIGLAAHNSSLYYNEVALLSQLAFDTSSPFGQSALAAALRGGTYYTGPSLRFALSHDAAGIPGSGSARAYPYDDFVLGGFGKSRITLDASDFLSMFLARNNFDGPPIKIDGGPGGALLVVKEGASGGFGAPVADGSGGFLLPYVFPNTLWGALTGAPLPTVHYASLHRIDAILNQGVFGLGGTNSVVDTRGYRKLDGSAPNVQTPSKSGGLPPPDAMFAPEAGVSALPQLVVDPSFDYTDAGDESLMIIGSGKGDIIALGAGDSTVVETAGDNFIYVKDATSAGDLTINGGSGNDNIVVGHGINVVTAGSGHDTITLTGGKNTLTGGADADSFVIGGGTTEITDFSLDDVIVVNNANAVILSQKVANSKLTIVLDVDGTGGADATVILDNITHPMTREVSGPTSTFQVSALATTSAGGYLSGATLIADIDGDGARDPEEDSATSDGNGTFILSPTDKGQYVAAGGTDGFTGLPFGGTLTAPVGASVITPLTTLVNEVMQAGGGDLATAEQTVRSALGLDPSISLIGADPIGQTSLGDAPYRAALAAGVKIVDTAALVAATLSGIKGDAAAIFGDTTSAIGAAIKNLGGGQAYDLDNQNTIKSLIAGVAQTQGITLASAAVDSLAAAIADSNQAVDEALQNDPGTSTIRAVQTIAQGQLADALQTAAGDAGKIGSTVAAFTGTNLDSLIATQKGQLPVLPTMVSLTATTDGKGTLVTPGNVVTITLTTSKAMDVAGTPTLQLNDNQVADYASGNGSTKLVFTYTVQPLDSTPNLAVVGLHTPLGTVIQDSAGVQLNGPVAGNLGIQVGAAALVVTSIRATVSGGGNIAETGEVVTIHVNTNAPTTVQGTPTLQLSDQRVASYLSGAGSTSLSFTYTVQPGDNLPNLAVAGLNLPQGASIKDAVGNSFTEPLTAPLGVQLVSPTIVSIATTASTKAEGNAGTTAFTFTLTRSDGATTQSVSWSAAGSGASPANAADFAGSTLPSDTVSFAVGEISKVITITVQGDSTVESNEDFTVALANASAGLAIGTASASGTIVNDDAAVAIAASDTAKAEGNGGTTVFTFTVTRSGDTSGAQSVSWSVAGAGANPADAADFAGGTLPGGTVTFAVGETAKTVMVNVQGDTQGESNEGFVVTLASPSAGLTIATASASGTIQNDDASVSIAATAASKAEGNSGSTAFTFTVTRTGNTSAIQSVAWSVTGSGASPATAADFAGNVLPTGSVTFGVGETTKTVTIDVQGDITLETNESFTVTLANASAGLIIATASASGTIQNDDAGPLSVHDDAYVALRGSTIVVNAATGVLFNDDGSGLTASLKTAPSAGGLQLAADGSFTYTPLFGFAGVVTFAYRATSAGNSADGEAVLFVVPTVASPSSTTLDLLSLTSEQQIAATYAAFFGRAADAGGFGFWVGEFNRLLPVQGPAALFANIASSFGISPEAKALYPFLANPFGAADAQISAFLDSVYNNLFNRSSDAGGLGYWTGEIRNALANNQFVGSVLVNIMSGAQDTAAGKDISTLMGKVAVSIDYVHEQQERNTQWAGAADIAAATSLLDTVTATPQSILTGIKTAETLIANHA